MNHQGIKSRTSWIYRCDTETRVANMALLEWHDNIEISDEPPTDYVPQVQARFKDDQSRIARAARELEESGLRLSALPTRR